MISSVLAPAIYLFALALQIMAMMSAYHLLRQYQRAQLAYLFVLLILSAICIQFVYLFLSTLTSPATQLTNALLYLGNALIIWGSVFILDRFLRKAKHKVTRLATEMKFDSLTRALSRNTILFHCEHELAKAHRSRFPVSILVIDMDRFKQINDSYGHLIGDEVLVKSTRHCMRALREIDLIGRIGGDEFIILLPNTNFQAANEVAKRIKAEMKTVHTKLSISIPTPITLSIGIASYCPQAYSNYQQHTNIEHLLHELIRTSDRSMYAEKHSNHLYHRSQHLIHELAKTE